MIDLDDTDTTNDFDPGMNVGNFVYNPATSGFNLTVPYDGETETWTLYYTPSGLAVIDKGPLKGLRFNTLKGTSTNPADYGITAGTVYDAVFYGSQSETESGTSVGTVTVTAVGADNFTVSVDGGRGDPPQVVKGVAAASDLWRGFFSLQAEDGTPQNAAVQPVTAGAIVFAGKMGEWNYNYGIGIKR